MGKSRRERKATGGGGGGGGGAGGAADASAAAGLAGAASSSPAKAAASVSTSAASSMWAALLARMSSASEADREQACFALGAVMADQVDQGEQQLHDRELLRRVFALLTDSSVRVRCAASAALRNIAAGSAEELAEFILQLDAMTLLLPALQSASSVLVAEPQTADDTARAHEHVLVVLMVEHLVVTLAELCASSPRAAEAVTQRSGVVFTATLLEKLLTHQNTDNVACAFAYLLVVLTENNSDAWRQVPVSLLAVASSMLEVTASAVERHRMCALLCSFLVNASDAGALASQADVVRKVAALLQRIVAGFSVQRLQGLLDELLVLRARESTTSDASSIDRPMQAIVDVSTAYRAKLDQAYDGVSAVKLALETLANLYCVRETDSDDDLSDDGASDGGAARHHHVDGAASQRLALVQSTVPAQAMIRDVVSLCALPPVELRQKAVQCRAVKLFAAYVQVHDRALGCLGNILMHTPVETIGIEFARHLYGSLLAMLQQVLADPLAHEPSTAESLLVCARTVFSALPGIADRVHLNALLPVVRSDAVPLRVHGIGLLASTVAQVNAVAPLTGAEVQTLLGVCLPMLFDASLDVRCEAANALMDIFPDERFDDALRASPTFVSDLKRAVADLRQVRKSRDLPRNIFLRVAETRENLASFIAYKAEHGVL